MPSSPTPVPIDFTMAAAPFGWGGLLSDFADLFSESLTGVLDPSFLIGQTYGATPRHDIGPYCDGNEWWFFDPKTGVYQPGEQGCAIGTIALWAGGATVPSRWLPCNGQEVSRRTYSRLFQATGEIWGPGDGRSTFNVPPAGKIFMSAAGFVALSQVPIDTAASASTAAPGAEAAPIAQVVYPNQGVGSRGGAQVARLLLASDMPGLNPNLNSGLEATLVVQIIVVENGFPGPTPGVPIPNIQPAGATNADATFSFPITDSAGNPLGPGSPEGQTSVPTMPPFVAVNHMIKFQ